ncbi:acyl-CoA dehydrogenase [Deinococcus radiodurans]|jgi:butyryl-CoA dehydrogenase (EC 1.3.99.2)|uniref:Acyl-CoA dehydrogenase n=1 Tax=Deinococcus radiodurans (strain ATCC 13939 / DSM 20539 / JCM 16871 / CCUG 27074 / LMG 4051 / NBRC 15346 / NCIMB 9279 / VKM B-1422 / R1) TaxID=243230 RepID=Q9RUX5_DEIRA|nr:acyl-CoA dehydrogenase [Deinococcus radiodurans]AAF10828.1 acyl-CoA dehydrogenase [Deinococcus radiodurans R1 = ATCC 13939 = DSM 20539]ANC71582.1 acyl-CoA dehydrogenase [Deinococcus radiodurans R1 = ATCC 13939 = DSM 20539]QEM70728.1 acyl-CoA dehydrogenase [Deinococcus radiodurans]UDL00379.1 acyl-CoA dehydrogenase [Deinococcus radiodurans R1 = ATCC 13939 = DSM 20539]UID70246.1 acyl-CoA dehydrogenase [Deinococcus radiodurans R1 = ATCC 13939 = DSM 20539]
MTDNGMSFAPSSEQRMILQHVRDFCRAEIAPRAAEYDRSGEYPREQLRGLAELGLLGATVPEEWGGAGLDSVTYALCLEEIAAADSSVAVIVSVQNGLPEQMILNYGTDAQREKYLRPLASGEHIGAFCLTEAHAGSDAASLRLKAERDGDDWVLNGAKAWITSGNHADTFLVMARTGGPGARGVSCFIVERGTPGLSSGKPEHKMGQHAAQTTTVSFDNVRVPHANLVGEEGQGLIIALSSLDSGRIGIGMLGLGIARSALEHAAAYANEREQFGKKIREFEGVSFKIARMAARIESARLVGLKAAWLKDQGQPFSKEASIAKLLGSEAAVDVTRDAVQIFGGNGYSAEYPVEKLYRDAKITEIYEGTSEIQQLVISRAVFAELEK